MRPNFLNSLNSIPMPSPYEGLDFSDWETKTAELVQTHPLASDVLVEVVLGSWQDIFESSFGVKGYLIGREFFPPPQIMSFLMHELIPIELLARYRGTWRGQQGNSEKDLVYVPDNLYSVEIKASSSSRRIYGNRSYAQKGNRSRKSKSGYYLAINFQKFAVSSEPRVTLIRFGWLDHEDWTGQTAATGQQASLSLMVENAKLQVLYEM